MWQPIMPITEVITGSSRRTPVARGHSGFRSAYSELEDFLSGGGAATLRPNLPRILGRPL